MDAAAVDASDVVRLLLQFCAEKGLAASGRAIASETGVFLPASAGGGDAHRPSPRGGNSSRRLVRAVREGRWDAVLSFLPPTSAGSAFAGGDGEEGVDDGVGDDVEAWEGRWLVLPPAVHARLLEQIVLELAGDGEIGAAQEVMSLWPLASWMRENHAKRFSALHKLASGAAPFSAARVFAAYGGDKQQARDALAAELAPTSTADVASSRLESVIADAVRFRALRGDIQPGMSWDIFAGRPVQAKPQQQQVRNSFSSPPPLVPERMPPTGPARRPLRRCDKGAIIEALNSTIDFEDGSHAECAVFSPDGFYVVTGSVDGFIEIWDVISGELSRDFEFQTTDVMMMHDAAVLCAAFSVDGTLLATGSRDGVIKVWDLDTGKCLRRLDMLSADAALPAAGSGHDDSGAHGVTAITFSSDPTQLLSGGADGSVTLWGLKGGSTMQRFRGHTSSISAVALHPSNDSRIITASLDGSMGIWDLRTGERLHEWFPGAVHSTKSGLRESQPFALKQMAFFPNSTSLVLVCGASSSVYVFDVETGNEVRRLSAPGADNLRDEASHQSNARERAKAGTTRTQDFVGVCTNISGLVYGLLENGKLVCFDAESDDAISVRDTGIADPIGIAHHPHMAQAALWGLDTHVQLWAA